jgi:hypothetical protein
MRQPVRAAIVAFAVLFVVAGCTGGATPRPTPNPTRATPSPIRTLTEILTARGEEQLPSLLDGATAPPFVASWSDVQALKPLPTAMQKAFCDTLDLPLVDSGLTALLYAGLRAATKRIAKVDLPAEGKKILKFAVKYTVDRCPDWIPTFTPAPTPTPDWFPDGYRAVVGNPDLAWAYRLKSELRCGTERCMDFLVVAREGCPLSLGVGAYFVNDDNVLVDTRSASVRQLAAMETAILHVGTPDPTGSFVYAAWFLCL